MVKGQVKGFRCVRGKRKTWWYQSYSWFKTSVRDHNHAQIAFIYCDPGHSSDWRETPIYNLRYCRLKLFFHGWLIPMLISWVLTNSTKLSNLSQHSLNKKKTWITSWRLLLSAWAVCLHSARHLHTLITQSTIRACSETPPVSFIWPVLSNISQLITGLAT